MSPAELASADDFAGWAAKTTPTPNEYPKAKTSLKKPLPPPIVNQSSQPADTFSPAAEGPSAVSPNVEVIQPTYQLEGDHVVEKNFQLSTRLIQSIPLRPQQLSNIEALEIFINSPTKFVSLSVKEMTALSEPLQLPRAQPGGIPIPGIYVSSADKPKQFSDLPESLRRMIWIYSIPCPRVLAGPRQTLLNATEIPSMLQVNRESRSIFQSMYHNIMYKTGISSGIFVNFDLDVFYITNATLGFWARIFEAVDHAELFKIQKLALHWEIFDDETCGFKKNEIETESDSGKQQRHLLYSLLPSLAAFQPLNIIIYDNFEDDHTGGYNVMKPILFSWSNVVYFRELKGQSQEMNCHVDLDKIVDTVKQGLDKIGREYKKVDEYGAAKRAFAIPECRYMIIEGPSEHATNWKFEEGARV